MTYGEGGESSRMIATWNAPAATPIEGAGMVGGAHGIVEAPGAAQSSHVSPIPSQAGQAMRRVYPARRASGAVICERARAAARP